MTIGWDPGDNLLESAVCVMLYENDVWTVVFTAVGREAEEIIREVEEAGMIVL